MKFAKLWIAVAILGSSLNASAQEEWKANVGANGIFNTGNSEGRTFGGNALVSVKKNKDQVGWTANGTYGRATDPITGVSSINAENWMTQVRYDRFLSEIFSLYGLAHMNHDKLAGIDLNYGASPGFAHFLYKTDITAFRYELGFDYTRERFTTNIENNLYSARAYLFVSHKFSESASFSQDMENLINVEDSSDYRINAATALNLKMTQKVAFQVGYVIRFDNQPVPGFKKVDTTAQLGLNINFL